MKPIVFSLRILPLLSVLLSADAQQWSAEQAQAWCKDRAWLVGSNFTPSTAINQN